MESTTASARDLDDPQQLTIPRLLAVFDRCKRIPPERALWRELIALALRRGGHCGRLARRRDARSTPSCGCCPKGQVSIRWDESYNDVMRRYFMDEARADGYEVIDMQPVFVDHYRSHGEPFNWTRDKHWNALGHGLCAEQVARSHVMGRLQAVAADPSAILQSR